VGPTQDLGTSLEPVQAGDLEILARLRGVGASGDRVQQTLRRNGTGEVFHPGLEEWPLVGAAASRFNLGNLNLDRQKALGHTHL
jgi:hypothetical protein